MACGATFTAPSANAWLAGNYLAAPGQVNAVAATSDVFRITGVTVLPGSEAPSAARSPFIMRPFDQELVTCQRYWQKSYPYASPAGTLAAGGALSLVLFGTTGTGNLAGMTEHFVVSMRAAPTITAYSQRTGASGMISDDYAAADTPATINLISEKRFRWYGATIAPNLVNFTMQFVADARL
jgi:hypothetical protein